LVRHRAGLDKRVDPEHESKPPAQRAVYARRTDKSPMRRLRLTLVHAEEIHRADKTCECNERVWARRYDEQPLIGERQGSARDQCLCRLSSSCRGWCGIADTPERIGGWGGERTDVVAEHNWDHQACEGGPQLARRALAQ
jgi:hypothetical protein